MKRFHKLTRCLTKGITWAHIAGRLMLPATFQTNPRSLTYGRVSQSVSVSSEPPGAEVTWKQYAEMKAPWQKMGRTPLDKFRIPAGPIRIQVTISGYEAVEAAVDRVSSLGNASLTTYDFKLDRVGPAHSQMVHIPRRPAASGLFEGKPPYQCVVYMADGGTLRPGSGDTIRPESYILRSGRAMCTRFIKELSIAM